MAKYHNEVQCEVMSSPEMVRYIARDIEGRCQSIFTAEELRNFDNIVLTGCGDSLCAATAVKQAYETFTGLHIDTPVCIDLSRHYDVRRFGAPGKTLVIVISFSGKVKRVVEAAERAKKYGAVTMAVTHFADTPVAQACDRVLTVQPDEYALTRSPGCRTYMASMTALYLFAMNMGLAIGNYDKVQYEAHKKAMLGYVDAYSAEALDRLDDQLYDIVKGWLDIPYFEFVGAGPDFTTAWFAQAKIYEATGDFSRYENLEDWCHVDYFLRGVDSGMGIVVSSGSPSMSRALEVASILTRQKYRYIVYTDADPSIFPEPAKVLQLPKCDDLMFAPLMSTLPVCLFAAVLQAQKGVVEFRKDMMGTDAEPGLFFFDGNMMRNSKIEIH